MRHIAIVMDGNRRWAKSQNLISWQGHKKGVETVKQLLNFACKTKFNFFLYICFL